MTKYDVEWSKTYYASGRVEIEANSKEEAKEIVLERMGDYEGSMQYDADRDYVEAYDLVDNDKWLNDLWTSKKRNEPASKEENN